MKVLDNRAKAWTHALACPHCKSDLVIDASDVYQKTFTGTETTSTYYSVECAACTREIDIGKRAGMPDWVLFTSKEKSAHQKSKESKQAKGALFLGDSVPCAGEPGDRGCVSCGQIAKDAKDKNVYVVDGRDRYWCLDCVRSALANVRRRVDARTDYPYPWIFPKKPSELKHGPGGLGGRGPCDVNCEKCAAEARLKPRQARQPALSFINLGEGMAKVTCTCGWEEAPMPISAFDPAEALAGASSAHPRCTE